jgi:hypothetical protein
VPVPPDQEPPVNVAEAAPQFPAQAQQPAPGQVQAQGVPAPGPNAIQPQPPAPARLHVEGIAERAAREPLPPQPAAAELPPMIAALVAAAEQPAERTTTSTQQAPENDRYEDNTAAYWDNLFEAGAAARPDSRSTEGASVPQTPAHSAFYSRRDHPLNATQTNSVAPVDEQGSQMGEHTTVQQSTSMGWDHRELPTNTAESSGYVYGRHAVSSAGHTGDAYHYAHRNYNRDPADHHDDISSDDSMGYAAEGEGEFWHEQIDVDDVRNELENLQGGWAQAPDGMAGKSNCRIFGLCPAQS